MRLSLNCTYFALGKSDPKYMLEISPVAALAWGMDTILFN